MPKCKVLVSRAGIQNGVEFSHVPGQEVTLPRDAQLERLVTAGHVEVVELTAAEKAEDEAKAAAEAKAADKKTGTKTADEKK